MADHSELYTHYPDLPPNFGLQYFTAQQEQITPLCIVEPRSADAVSIIVRSIREYQCSFAIKSGGHNTNTGVSNRQDGLVIDLKYLAQVKVSENREIVSVGPGKRWGELYQELEQQGLTVVGGRVASVGVGGVALGGGLSFISRRYGWALDNILGFQVVLPNGTVAEVNSKSHPDLLFALRGGNSNFGIVTRFDLEAHPDEPLWGGMNAFVDLAREEHADPAAHAYIFFAWTPNIGSYIHGAAYFYAPAIERPPVFENLTAFPTLYSTNRFAPMSDFTKEGDGINPRGLRHYWATTTFKVDKELISKFWDIIITETDSIRLTVPDALASTNLQLLPKDQLAVSRNGPNAFGIDPEDGPLFLFSYTVSYKSAKDDEKVQNMANSILSKAVELGKQMGLHHPFIYPNYAATGQDIYAGFSAENRQRLLEIQEAYDPGRVFSGLQPDHLKLR
ncbi:FAD-binding domain-containing protein [Thozetella sp. PMI_491]|nr:FAD-binding domain-containing protein [Thozetella sp. PMI_491]